MAVLLASVTFFSTGLGGLCAMRFRDRLHLLLGLASGAVLGVVFFDVLPEVFSIEGTPSYITLGTAGGFLAFFALERITALHRSREHEHAKGEHEPELGVLSAVGFCIHSFLDGVAIGVGFQASAALGVVIALAIIAHDFSDGLNTVTVMLAHGNPVRRASLLLLLDMTTPLMGAASTLLFQVPESALAWILAFFSGSFLYIGASDLLPEAREHDSPAVAFTTVLGMAAIFAVTRALPR
jgi:zinc transporter, ZIP family